MIQATSACGMLKLGEGAGGTAADKAENESRSADQAGEEEQSGTKEGHRVKLWYACQKRLVPFAFFCLMKEIC